MADAAGTVRLAYVILYVPDVAASVAFYEAAFGLARRFVHESGTYGEMETGGTTLAFAAETLAESHGFAFRRTRPDAEAPGVEVALMTDDVAAAYRRALDAGAAAAMDPQVQPWGQTVAYVRDLTGHIVEICSPVA